MFNMTPMYSTKKFTEIFNDYGTFKYHYLNCNYPKLIDSDDTNDKISSLQTLYYLLYARYGNSPIANYDENQFIYKLFGVVFQYGPTWEKKLDIQSKLRNLTDAEIATGTKAIYNHAFNPGEIDSEIPSSTTGQPELQYVNDQNVTNYTKSKMDAYTQLWELLATDVTSEFLIKFNGLFKKFAQPGTYLYMEDEDD